MEEPRRGGVDIEEMDVAAVGTGRGRPIRTLLLGLILSLVPMTTCETMLYWPSPN